MSQFEKSICERNLKLWNSIWSLCLCLSLSISFFLSSTFHSLCAEKKMQRCTSWERWQIIVDADNLYNTHGFEIRLKFSAGRLNLKWIKETDKASYRGWQRCLLSFLLTLWHVTFNKALSQYFTSCRYSFNFSCILSSDSTDSHGLKWSYRTRKSRVIEMQSTYSFFPPSVHSAVTTLSRVAYQPEPQEQKQQHLCLTERERLL